MLSSERIRLHSTTGTLQVEQHNTPRANVATSLLDEEPVHSESMPAGNSGGFILCYINEMENFTAILNYRMFCILRRETEKFPSRYWKSIIERVFCAHYGAVHTAF